MSNDDAVPMFPLNDMLGIGLNATSVVLSDPAMKKLLDDPNTKFDVVMTVVFIAHEAGYYLAHR
jgi:hypothetical protein